MKSITRSKSGDATDRTADIYETASALFDKIEKRPIRLVGITLNNLMDTPDLQMTLFDAGKDSRQVAKTIGISIMKAVCKDCYIYI